MIWLRLVWWVFWRGLLYGGISGIVMGTIFAPFTGTVYGVLIGTIMGAVLGLLNGLSLVAMTRLFFNPPVDRSRYLGCIRIVVVPIDFMIAFILLMSGFGYVAVIPALLIAIAAFVLSPAFADYTAAQLSSRQSPANVLS